MICAQAGSGIRGARYLKQAGADAVWTNDLNPQLLGTQALNLLCPDPQSLGGWVKNLHQHSSESESKCLY